MDDNNPINSENINTPLSPEATLNKVKENVGEEAVQTELEKDKSVDIDKEKEKKRKKLFISALAVALAVGVSVSTLFNTGTTKKSEIAPTPPTTSSEPVQDGIENFNIPSESVESEEVPKYFEATPHEYFIIENVEYYNSAQNSYEELKTITGFNFPEGGLRTVIIPKDIESITIGGLIDKENKGNYDQVISDVKILGFQEGSGIKRIDGLQGCQIDEIRLPDTCVMISVGDVSRLSIGNNTMNVAVGKVDYLDISNSAYRFEYEKNVSSGKNLTEYAVKNFNVLNIRLGAEGEMRYGITIKCKDEAEAVEVAKYLNAINQSRKNELEKYNMTNNDIEKYTSNFFIMVEKNKQRPISDFYTSNSETEENNNENINNEQIQEILRQANENDPWPEVDAPYEFKVIRIISRFVDHPNSPATEEPCDITIAVAIKKDPYQEGIYLTYEPDSNSGNGGMVYYQLPNNPNEYMEVR